MLSGALTFVEANQGQTASNPASAVKGRICEEMGEGFIGRGLSLLVKAASTGRIA